MSKPFHIKSGVKLGCVLMPTAFNIFFSMVLKHALESQLKGCNYITDQTVDCSTLRDLDQKLIYRRSLLEAYCSLTMQQLIHTLSKTCSVSWTYLSSLERLPSYHQFKKKNPNVVSHDTDTPPVIPNDKVISWMFSTSSSTSDVQSKKIYPLMLKQPSHWDDCNYIWRIYDTHLEESQAKPNNNAEGGHKQYSLTSKINPPPLAYASR